MKFLLTAVNAKYIHSNPAIYSLRAYSVQKDSELEKNIELAEYTINQPFQDILADIYRRKPDCMKRWYAEPAVSAAINVP